MGGVWQFQLFLYIKLIYDAFEEHDPLQHRVHYHQRERCGRRGPDVEQHAQQEGIQSVPDDDVPALLHVMGCHQLFRLCVADTGEGLHQRDHHKAWRRADHVVPGAEVLAVHTDLPQHLERYGLWYGALSGKHHGDRSLAL